MNGVLGHSALVRLHWARDNVGRKSGPMCYHTPLIQNLLLYNLLRYINRPIVVIDVVIVVVYQGNI